MKKTLLSCVLLFPLLLGCTNDKQKERAVESSPSNDVSSNAEVSAAKLSSSEISAAIKKIAEDSNLDLTASERHCQEFTCTADLNLSFWGHVKDETSKSAKSRYSNNYAFRRDSVNGINLSDLPKGFLDAYDKYKEALKEYEMACCLWIDNYGTNNRDSFDADRQKAAARVKMAIDNMKNAK